jgi:hypothetical protein
MDSIDYTKRLAHLSYIHKHKSQGAITTTNLIHNNLKIQNI